jgi:hypothetical protein
MPGAGVYGSAYQDGFSGHRDARTFQHHDHENRAIAVMLDNVLDYVVIEEIHARRLPPAALERLRVPAFTAGSSASLRPRATQAWGDIQGIGGPICLPSRALCPKGTSWSPRGVLKAAMRAANRDPCVRDTLELFSVGVDAGGEIAVRHWASKH